MLRLYLALEKWELNATAQLLKSHAIHVDETSLRVDKKNHWIHGEESFIHRDFAGGIGFDKIAALALVF